MPSPAALASPQQHAPAGPASPHASSGRPPLVKRHSSQSSHGGSRQNVTSPGSAGEHHPLRHHAVGGGQGRRHAKIVLPRNHSSGRNLAKMGRQAETKTPGHVAEEKVEDGGKGVNLKHARQRSHEGDTEIRLPGSLDESSGRSMRPAIKRHMTAYELPRNRSGTKLKKNYSHGQLTRLQSGKTLSGMASASKAPPSPGLKGKKRRPKSAEMVPEEKDLHQLEAELCMKQQEEKEQKAAGPKKVGFAVGSSGDTSEDDAPTMDGSGMQEDEWTDQSASASPYSTRQNTANNSRRPSMANTEKDKPPDRAAFKSAHPSVNFSVSEARQQREPGTQVQASRPEADGTPAASEVDDDEVPSSQSMTPAPALSHELPLPKSREDQLPPPSQPPQQQPKPPQIRSPLHAAKDHPNPAVQRLTSNQMPAPALVSSVSALDDGHSTRASPASSMRGQSITGNDGAQDEGELISRFLPSASHPSTGTGSGGNTGAMNTPKTGSFQAQTPEEDSTLHRAKAANFHIGGPTSPGSTLSGSSGAATPAHGRSRIELRMLHDKALADREAAAENQPLVPHHIYDRRNETLKSYLNLAAIGQDATLRLGPEIFQGRFKAVNTELKVVQKFRDPIAESVDRLRHCRSSKLSQRSSLHKHPHSTTDGLKTSKSAVALPSRPRAAAVKEGSKLSTSVSPPKSTPPKGAQAKSDSPEKLARSAAIASAKSAVSIQNSGELTRKGSRRGVSFAGAEPQVKDVGMPEEAEAPGPNAVAKALWDNVYG